MANQAASLTRVNGGSYAWLQPDGGWGLSNAGLVIGDDQAVLIDTLFDLTHTRRMLDLMRPLTEQAPIRTAVNTHGNGDHWFGNELLAHDVRIIAAEETVTDMHAVGPGTVAGLLALPGRTGDYARGIFGAFDFAPIRPRYPSESYRGELQLTVGGVDLLLIDVGPAHTSADTIVYCERDGVVFTGDILFAGGTPIMWAGPVENWIRACARIRALGARFLVPGHGPISRPSRAQDMADYLEYVREQAARRHDLGMAVEEAARDIVLGQFAGWPEAERLAANVATIYTELGATPSPAVPGPEMFGCMASLRAHWGDAPDQSPDRPASNLS